MNIKDNITRQSNQPWASLAKAVGHNMQTSYNVQIVLIDNWRFHVKSLRKESKSQNFQFFSAKKKE